MFGLFMLVAITAGVLYSLSNSRFVLTFLIGMSTFIYTLYLLGGTP